MIFAIAMLAAAPEAVEIPPFTDANGKPTLLGLFDAAYWDAYPGCLSFESKSMQSQHRKLTARLGSVQKLLEVRYGAEVIAKYEDEHLSSAHSIHYIKCPVVSAKYIQDFRRSIVRLEKAIGQSTLER